MFTEHELDYLSGQQIGRLATSRADGTLQNDPVGFGVNAAPTDAADQMQSGAVIRIHPTRILSVGLEPGDLDAEPHEAGVRSRSVP